MRLVYRFNDLIKITIWHQFVIFRFLIWLGVWFKSELWLKNMDQLLVLEGKNSKTLNSSYLSTGFSSIFQPTQFTDSFCRLLAFVVSGIVILSSKQPRHGCPLYKFSYASFSNIMSSWFQYEALKFVSFPTQVQFSFINYYKG